MNYATMSAEIARLQVENIALGNDVGRLTAELASMTADRDKWREERGDLCDGLVVCKQDLAAMTSERDDLLALAEAMAVASDVDQYLPDRALQLLDWEEEMEQAAGGPQPGRRARMLRAVLRFRAKYPKKG